MILVWACALAAQAQNYDDKWIMGYPYELDGSGNFFGSFNNGLGSGFDTSSIFKSNLGTSSGVGMIVDQPNNVMIYSNGCRVLNQDLEYIEGAEVINFSASPYTWLGFCDPPSVSEYYPSTTATLLLPWPDSSNQFWLGTASTAVDLDVPNNYLKEFYTCRIDMNQNAGKGKLMDSTWLQMPIRYAPSHITACPHDNGKDWWIAMQGIVDSGFMIMKLTSEGISSIDYQKSFGRPVDIDSFLFYGGGAMFSPDGKQFTFYYTSDSLQLYDFDDITGKLSNYRLLEIPYQKKNFLVTAGCVFSPNSRFLYASEWNKLYQWDLQDPDIAGSRVLVGRTDTIKLVEFPYEMSIASLRLAPNGKIYCGSGGAGFTMSYIAFPNKKGEACEFKANSIRFPSPNSFYLPNTNHFRADKAPKPKPMSTATIHEQLQIYPNPAKEVIHILTKGKKIKQVDLVDMQGRVMLAKDHVYDEISSLDIKHIDVGTYQLIVYFMDKSSAVTKVLIQR